MNCLAAFMLSAFKGKPSVAVAQEIAKCADVTIEGDKLKAVETATETTEINTLITEGLGKLTSVPQGAAVAAAPSSTGAPKAAEVEAPKEEAKAVEEEEEEVFGFGGLF